MIVWTDGTSLYHYGIPGQKRGERRYQNYDGTYTEEGLRRKRLTYPSYGRQLTGKKKKNKEPKDPTSTKLQETRNALNAASDITNRTNDVVDIVSKMTNKDVPDYVKNMTDQELRAEVNRMLLENQYTNLKNNRDNKGKDYVNTILKIAGDVASIGANAATIALAIWTIKNNAGV